MQSQPRNSHESKEDDIFSTIEHYNPETFSSLIPKLDEYIRERYKNTKLNEKEKQEAFLAEFHFLQTFNSQYDNATGTVEVNGGRERVLDVPGQLEFRLDTSALLGYGELPQTIEFDEIECQVSILNYLLDPRIKALSFFGFPIPDFDTVQKWENRKNLTAKVDDVIKAAILDKIFGDANPNKDIKLALIEAVFKALILIPRIILNVPITTVINILSVFTEYLPRRNASPIALFIGRSITSPFEALRDYYNEFKIAKKALSDTNNRTSMLNSNSQEDSSLILPTNPQVNDSNHQDNSISRMKPVAKMVISMLLTVGFAAMLFPAFKLLAGLKMVAAAAKYATEKLPAKLVSMFKKVANGITNAQKAVGSKAGTPALLLVEGATLTLGAGAAKVAESGTKAVVKKISTSECAGRTYKKITKALKRKHTQPSILVDASKSSTTALTSTTRSAMSTTRSAMSSATSPTTFSAVTSSPSSPINITPSTTSTSSTKLSSS